MEKKEISIVHLQIVKDSQVAYGEMRLDTPEKAAGLLLSHTHPSGGVKPSQEDIAITRKIRDAGKILDIPLQDHIILGSTGDYFSFRESNFWDAAA